MPNKLLVTFTFLITIYVLYILTGCGIGEINPKLKPLKPFDLTSGWCLKAANINTDRCIDIIQKEANDYYQ